MTIRATTAIAASYAVGLPPGARHKQEASSVVAMKVADADDRGRFSWRVSRRHDVVVLRDFELSDQPEVRRLILSGMRERWRERYDDAANPDIDDMSSYLANGGEIVVREEHGAVVGTGTPALEPDGGGRIVRVSVSRRQGDALRSLRLVAPGLLAPDARQTKWLPIGTSGQPRSLNRRPPGPATPQVGSDGPGQSSQGGDTGSNPVGGARPLWCRSSDFPLVVRLGTGSHAGAAVPAT
jgi:hypothetical protein